LVATTQSTQTELEFEAHLSRSVVARFDGGTMTSDGGELIAQRGYGLASGYEDRSDQDQLRQDPLLAVLSGKPRVGEEP